MILAAARFEPMTKHPHQGGGIGRTGMAHPAMHGELPTDIDAVETPPNQECLNAARSKPAARAGRERDIGALRRPFPAADRQNEPQARVLPPQLAQGGGGARLCSGGMAPTGHVLVVSRSPQSQAGEEL